MAIPTTALVWSEPMDPYDVVDYVVDCTNILDDAELLASYTIVPYSEASLLGLSVGTATYAPVLLEGNKIRIWLQVDAAYQNNAAFDGNGATLPIQLSITSSSIPPRRRQRTLVVKVQQR